MAPRAGFEPATKRLTAVCSTTELPRNIRSLFVAFTPYNKSLLVGLVFFVIIIIYCSIIFRKAICHYMESKSSANNLAGKMLIASPFTLYGDVFYKSLILVLSHTKHGSIGLIVNQRLNHVQLTRTFPAIDKNTDPLIDMVLPMYFGGPVEPERGFFIHSGEYAKNLLFKFSNNLSVSSNFEIVKDMATGNGPQKSLFIVGYTGWGAYQLEKELMNNLWIVAECDQQLVFAEGNEKKWATALKSIGIDKSHFLPKIANC